MQPIFRKRFSFIPLSLTLLIIFSSCGVVYKSMIQDDGHQLPPELGNSKTTMLLVKHKRGYDKALEKNFEKYYKGDYLLVSEDDLKDKKYQDTSKYRYLFGAYLSSSIVRDFSNTSNPTATTTLTGQGYSVFDRTENKNYASNIHSGLWKKLMRVYVQELNKVYEKNSNK